MRKILGVSAFYHDSAASLIIDGEIVAAAQEERFTRIKHTAAFPVNAIRYCLSVSGTRIDELDVFAFYDKPLLKFERLLETYYEFAPKGFISFIKAIPVWSREKLFLKKIILDYLAQIECFDKKKIKFLFPEHHLSHAASAFFPSPFRKAAILTIDGVGEWATTTISLGEDNKILMLKEMRFPHSLGLLYSSFTYFMGFKVNSGEYKLMGLAPYGNPQSPQTLEFLKIIKEKLVKIKEDGSIYVNQVYFKYPVGLKMVNEKKWTKLFGFNARKPEEDIEEKHCNLAWAIQNVTEEIILKLAREAKRITGADYLCLAGGVALNSAANGKILKENLFKDIFIQPAAGDAGGSIGAALAANYIYFEEKKLRSEKYDQMKGSLLGSDFSDKEIALQLKKFKAVYDYEENLDDLCVKIAELLKDGNTIGWFQGRMEFGPRALGNRSILADARNPEMQKQLNLKIKFRERFRPFAPSVLLEDANKYFQIERPAPYMTVNVYINEELRNKLPENYSSFNFWERLYYSRNNIPAVTHLDYSARVQTVNKETNPRFWKLLNKFKELTSCSLLINTSFNVSGEPIVCSPEDAYLCFMNSDLDYLVLNNYILKKSRQPEFDNKNRWRRKFNPD